MAVRIRLMRMGKIRNPQYRIVVADSRTKRDGRVIEEIGKYHPTEHPSYIEVDSERAQYWLGVGAQPTEQVAAILKLTGDWGRYKGDASATSTVQTREEKTPFVAEPKKNPIVRPKREVEDAREAAVADAAADTERAGEADESVTVERENVAQDDNDAADQAR